MKILLASSEVHPFSKTGGLADMVGAMGKALAEAGHQVGLVTPLYGGIRERFPEIKKIDWHMDLPLGPRRVQAGLLCISAVGSMLFSQAFSHTGLVVASALIGLGFAGGLMASFKAVILWLPADRIALGNGCIMAFGGLGTVAATIPANWAADCGPKRTSTKRSAGAWTASSSAPGPCKTRTGWPTSPAGCPAKSSWGSMPSKEKSRPRAG